MAKPESVFWQQIKKNIKGISFTRLESWASLGVPDLLCYNEKGTFFTVELKVTRSNKISLSPHQIAFHQEPRSLCLETLWGNHKALQRIKNHGAKRKRPEA
jgi:hypothetical protein